MFIIEQPRKGPELGEDHPLRHLAAHTDTRDPPPEQVHHGAHHHTAALGATTAPQDAARARSAALGATTFGTTASDIDAPFGATIDSCPAWPSPPAA